MLRVVSPSVASALTLAEAKAHLRVDADDDDHDAVIGALLAAARSHVEQWLGYPLLASQMALTAPAPRGADPVPLAAGPVVAVSGVETMTAGVYAALPDGDWVYRQTGPNSGRVRLVGSARWPAMDDDDAALRVSLSSGWAGPADIPFPLRAAIMLTLGDLFTNRDGKVVSNMVRNPAVLDLLHPWRAVPL
jgi:uncharacterized phiE125 gp8 family phage protein